MLTVFVWLQQTLPATELNTWRWAAGVAFSALVATIWFSARMVTQRMDQFREDVSALRRELTGRETVNEAWRERVFEQIHGWNNDNQAILTAVQAETTTLREAWEEWRTHNGPTTTSATPSATPPSRRQR